MIVIKQEYEIWASYLSTILHTFSAYLTELALCIIVVMDCE